MKKILVIIPYQNLYPSINGGMQRCFHILHQLSIHFSVTAVIKQDKDQFLKASEEYPSLSGIRLYSTANEKEPTDIFSLFPGRIKTALRYRWYKKKIRESASSDFVALYPIVKKLVRQNDFDVVVFENQQTFALSDIVRNFQPAARIIYDAHNVDSDMAFIEFEKGLLPKDMATKILIHEKQIWKYVDGIIACSKTDLNKLQGLNDNKLTGKVIPNGVKLFSELFDDEVKKDKPLGILFCGSLNYPPNAEGILWFYQKVWPEIISKLEGIQLIILGSGEIPAELYDLKNDPAISFTGAVKDVKPYYRKAAVSVVPLKSGSGTRLKVLEAMGLGIPVVSTLKGAEGIEYEQKKDIEIADDEDDFAAAVIDLMEHVLRRKEIQQSARSLVEEKYDWNTIGKNLSDYINHICT